MIYYLSLRWLKLKIIEHINSIDINNKYDYFQGNIIDNNIEWKTCNVMKIGEAKEKMRCHIILFYLDLILVANILQFFQINLFYWKIEKLNLILFRRKNKKIANETTLNSSKTKQKLVKNFFLYSPCYDAVKIYHI